MENTPLTGEFLVVYRALEAASGRDKSTFELSPADKKIIRFDDTASRCEQAAGPACFHEATVLWACEHADMVLIEAGWIGADSEIELQTALNLSTVIVSVQTFQQRVDQWSRALRPYLRVDVPFFLAVLPAKLTYTVPDIDKFEEVFRVAFSDAGRAVQ